MWKKQWNKLKTALGTPEQYVEDEQEELVEEQAEPEEEKYCSDPVVEISPEHIAPVISTLDNIRVAKQQIGEMTIRQEQERSGAIAIFSQLNTQLQQQIDELRTIYNVEPTVDYALNFPSEKGGVGTFVSQSKED